MPIARVTNISTEKLYLRTLYDGLNVGETVDIARSAADLMNWPDLHEAIANGTASLEIIPSAAETASGFVPYPGVGSGTVGGKAFVWNASTTWEQLYTDIVASGGMGTVMVINDGQKEMTPNTDGTDLSGLWFIGVADGDGNLPTIDIDSLGVGGFVLSGTSHNIQSKGVFWNSYYRIGDSLPICWTFDGGGFTSATTDDVYRHLAIHLVLSNGAVVDGSNCTDALFVGINIGASALMYTGASLGKNVFKTNKGVPPWPLVSITRDASTTVDGDAIQGSFGHGPITKIDQAEFIGFVDDGNPPTLSANVQDAINGVKRYLGSYQPTFVNSDLVAGKIGFNHGFGLQYVSVSVYDDNDIQVVPDAVRAVDANNVEIDLTSKVPITGTWKAGIR